MTNSFFYLTSLEKEVPEHSVTKTSLLLKHDVKNEGLTF